MFCSNKAECFSQCNNNDNNSQEVKRPVEFLDQAYRSLSPEEKESVLRDLYGRDTLEENEELINEKLQELESELGRLSQKTKNAYNQAIDMQQQRVAGGDDSGNDEYVTSRKFRLMFLRADRFDARLAARRLTMHFKEKLSLFGKDKLARRIMEEDLDEQDKAVLYSGFYSFTGASDESGRFLGFIHKAYRFLDRNITSLKRAVFYLIQTTVEDNEVLQKRGLVQIIYNLGSWFKVRNAAKMRRMIPAVRMLHRALPFRFAGVHICYNDLLYHLFLHFVLVAAKKDARDRAQCHYGEHGECMVELIKYGIEPDDLPFSSDGELRNDVVHSYLRRLKENPSS